MFNFSFKKPLLIEVSDLSILVKKKSTLFIPRFINDKKTVSPDKLIFLKAISNVVKSGMDIVGVDTPDKM